MNEIGEENSNCKVDTMKREQARDLAATMAVSTTTTSITEQRKPSKTTGFEQRLSLSPSRM